MSENEEKLRSALREYAVRLDANIGKIRCRQCGGAWVPGTPENHNQEDCLASRKETRPRFVESDENLRAALTAWEIPWPVPDPTGESAPKERCSKLARLNRRAQYQDHYMLPPRAPDRVVYADTEEDFLLGDGDADSRDHGRTLTDEEWAAALAAYEKAKADYEKSGGHYWEKTGPDIIDAVFILENGGHAKARWCMKAWAFLEWTSEPYS